MPKQKMIVEIDGEKAIKLTFSNVIYGILILIVLLLGTGSVLAYGTNTVTGQKIAAQVSQVIPFPAAIIDWKHVIFFKDVKGDIDAIQQFYQSQNVVIDGKKVDFDSADGQKKLLIKEREVLDKLIEDQIIENLAKQNGITISSAEVDQAVNLKLKEFGTSNDVKSDLLKSFGWNIDDFKEKVVLPSMYSEALVKVISSQLSNDQAKSKIQAAQKALVDGADFAKVANQYSEGSSKNNGGELGWVTKAQVVPELGDALFGNQQLQKNAIIESAIGYHIVEIENKKKENNADVLQIRQIFVAKNTFADWLSKQKQKVHVLIPMREFIWNSSTGSVDFSDTQMKDYEKNARTNATIDESLIL